MLLGLLAPCEHGCLIKMVRKALDQAQKLFHSNDSFFVLIQTTSEVCLLGQIRGSFSKSSQLHHDHQYTTTTTTPHTITSTLHQRPNLHKLFASDDDNDNTNNSDAKSPPSSTALAANDDEYEASVATSPKAVSQSQAVFDEASDALQSVGWASPIAEGEMTSDDPFVRRIEAQIMEESGVGLEELLNPAKVINLERDLYNLRSELASLTGKPAGFDVLGQTTEDCDGGRNGGEE